MLDGSSLTKPDGGVSSRKAQVRRFYEVLWNEHDLTAIPSIFHNHITFRGSLGEEKRGYDGIAEYVDKVHRALGNYQCIIQDLVEERDRVFARMKFQGVHRRKFLGFEPSGNQIHWQGCALFTFLGERILDLWVLGDLKSLEDQLRRPR